MTLYLLIGTLVVIVSRLLLRPRLYGKAFAKETDALSTKFEVVAALASILVWPVVVVADLLGLIGTVRVWLSKRRLRKKIDAYKKATGTDLGNILGIGLDDE